MIYTDGLCGDRGSALSVYIQAEFFLKPFVSSLLCVLLILVLLPFIEHPVFHIPPVQEFRQKVMLGTPFVVIWLIGFVADLDIDSWLIKGVMYAGVWVAVQFLSKYVSGEKHIE